MAECAPATVTPEAAAALPLADLINSALVLRVATADGRRMVWAGRLASSEVVRAVAACDPQAKATVWWADELAEALLAARAAPLLIAQALRTLAAIKAELGEALVLSAESRALVFAAPERTREEVQALWDGWPPAARAGYRARRSWALGRVPDTEEWKLRVARYAAERTEVALRRGRAIQ
jgi:hypothetical protein